MRRIAVSVAVAWALGGGCAREDRAATAPAAVRPGPRAVEPAPSAPSAVPAPRPGRRPPDWEGPWRPGQTREAPDLRAAYGTDGHIRLTGRDRWGRALDVTYESPRFFTAAIPALARSLTDAQAMRLRQLGYLLAEP